MNVKIQSKGIAGGQNTGSCLGYANYLEHENNEKVEAGMMDSTIPFFDSFGEAVNKQELVKSIDANTTQLHRDDAKYYSVILSFSDEEVKAMGATREEILGGVHKVVEGTMDLYARNFHCDDIRSHSDLKYYYTIHEYREGFKPGLHVHVIVSRKDAANSRKISPMTNHRGGTQGVIKRGFDRDSFYRSCEQMFDRSFGFDRKTEKSYDYYNTMKHGSVEQREAMIREVVKGNDTIREINEAVIRRVEQLAKEAHVPEYQQEYLRQVQAQPIERRNMNSFWNSYHSYYKPLLSSVKDSCNAAFDMYSDAKEKYGLCSERMSERYARLRTVYTEIDRLQNEINRARTSKTCIKAFSLLIAAVNPAPALVLALVGCILAESKKRAKIDQIKSLRSHAKQIKADVENLRSRQENLKMAKSDTLRAYIEVKDERQRLKAEVDTLKGMLEKSPAISEETLKELGRLVREGGFMEKVETYRKEEHADFGVSLYLAFLNSEDRLSLDLNLLSLNIICEPVLSFNGGVLDFKVIYKGQEYYAGGLLTYARLTEMLERWETLTGQTPAYKLTSGQELQEKTPRSRQQRELRPKNQQETQPKQCNELSQETKQNRPNNSLRR